MSPRATAPIYGLSCAHTTSHICMYTHTHTHTHLIIRGKHMCSKTVICCEHVISYLNYYVHYYVFVWTGRGSRKARHTRCSDTSCSCELAAFQLSCPAGFTTLIWRGAVAAAVHLHCCNLEINWRPFVTDEALQCPARAHTLSHTHRSWLHIAARLK